MKSAVDAQTVVLRCRAKNLTEGISVSSPTCLERQIVFACLTRLWCYLVPCAVFGSIAFSPSIRRPLSVLVIFTSSTHVMSPYYYKGSDSASTPSSGYDSAGARRVAVAWPGVSVHTYGRRGALDPDGCRALTLWPGAPCYGSGLCPLCNLSYKMLLLC